VDDVLFQAFLRHQLLREAVATTALSHDDEGQTYSLGNARDAWSEEEAKAGPVVHACPEGDAAIMPCCGLSPFEVPRWHRMTPDLAAVTCGKRTAGATPVSGARDEDAMTEEWTIGGVDPVERLMRQVRSYTPTSDQPPTRGQVAAVLHALADHTSLVQAVTWSVPVDGREPAATSVGRWLHAYGDLLDRS